MIRRNMKIFWVISILMIISQCQQTYGNFTDSQLTIIHNLIDAAQKKYLPSQIYTQMSKFISDYLTQLLPGGYYWNVIIFQNGVQSITLNDHPYRQQYYINKMKPGSLLTYVIWSDVSKMEYGYWVCDKKGQQQYGSGLDNKIIEKIKSTIQLAVIIKGNDVKENSQYIKDKLRPDSWSIIITDPSQQFSGYGYKSKKKQYAILQSYGIMKWTYFMIKIS